MNRIKLTNPQGSVGDPNGGGSVVEFPEKRIVIGRDASAS